MPEPKDKKAQTSATKPASQPGVVSTSGSPQGSDVSKKLRNAAEEEVAKSLEVSARAKANVEGNAAELAASLTKSNEEVVSKEQEFAREVNSANTSFESMKVKTSDSVNYIEKIAGGVSGNLQAQYESLKFASRVVPVATGIVYYLIYLAEFGLAYNNFAFGGIGIALPLALVLKVLLDRSQNEIQNSRIGLTRQFASTRQELGGFLNLRLQTQPNLKRARDSFTKAAAYGGLILSTLRDYIPALEAHYNARERMNNQLKFINSLRNSLVWYGFDVSGKLNDYLSMFGPDTNSAEEWIKEASEHLESMMGVPGTLIALMYFDYTGDLENKKNIWGAISTSESLIGQLSRVLISNGVVNTDYVEKDLERYGAVEKIIDEEIPFGLDSFRDKYNTYYFDLVREKLTAIDGLREYGTKISFTSEQRIKRFMPESLEQDKRLEQLFAAAAKETDVSSDVVQLAYFEREAEIQKRDQAWMRIKNQDNGLSTFVAKLIVDKLVDVPSHNIADMEKLRKFIEDALKREDSFTLASAKRRVQIAFDNLESEKETFLRLMSSRILLSEPDRKEFAEWLPERVSPEETAKWVQQRTGIPDYVMLLLYFDYIQDSRSRKAQFDSMRDVGKMRELSRTMLERNFIQLAEPVEVKRAIPNLTSLLMKLEDFDRPTIQSKFSTYNQLMDYATDVVEFLKEQQMIEQKGRISFEDVLDSVNLTETNPTRQYQLILGKIVRSYGSNVFNSSDWHEPILAATLALYLVARELSLSRPACKSAGSNDKASRILYQYSRVNDEEQQRGATVRTPFGKIVNLTIDGTYTDYEYLIPFKEELVSAGFLYPRISHLLHARLDLIDKNIGDRKKLEATIKKHATAANTFLESKLNANVILESLRMQLINAYMITNPSLGDVITGIIDVALPQACKELGKTDASYKNLVLLSEDSLGRGTRIGIVPFQMDFDKFSKLFETAFHLAVEKHRAAGATRPPEEFSGNVIRVFPSDAYFKQVEGKPLAAGVLSQNHPVQIIRRLVLRYYGAVENLELIASLQGKAQNKLAMRSLLTTFFDIETRIFLWAETQFNGVVGGSQFIDYIKDGPFDQELWAGFGCQTRSQLALTIFDTSGRDEANSNLVKQRMKPEIERIAKQSGARLDDAQVDNVTSIAYQVLYDMGWVLRGYA